MKNKLMVLVALSVMSFSSLADTKNVVSALEADEEQGFSQVAKVYWQTEKMN